MDDSDTSWSNLREPWERLRWARTRAGLTQDAFATAVGMKRTAYIKYEAPPGGGGTTNTKMRFEHANPWARKLKVRLEWLLNGQGLPWRDEETPEPLPEAAEAAEIISAEPSEAERRRMVQMLRLMKRTG